MHVRFGTLHQFANACHRLFRTHIGQLSCLVIGNNPGIFKLYHRQQQLPGTYIFLNL